MTASLLQQLNDEMAVVVAQVRRSLVKISRDGGGVGSGTIWHPDGLILTNAHVVQGRPDTLKVSLPDGLTLPAHLLALDEKHDLAALSVKTTGLPTIELGDSKSLRPGEWVLGVGHPWGVTGAVTAGAIIDVGERLEGGWPHGELLQVGLHLRPGHSGGPLVDVHGRLVGISTMINGPDVGLAIPLHVVKRFLRRALGSGPDTVPPAEAASTSAYI